MELSERTSREDARRKRLREVLDGAIAFYHRVLTESHHGQPALDYLRAAASPTRRSRPICWATRSTRGTRSHARWSRSATSTLDELEAAGLVTQRQGRRGAYDRFRGRIIFPIRDASGNATGLGGRIVGSEQRGEDSRDRGPKYLNSPATLLFDKSRTLYLIDRAKGAIRKAASPSWSKATRTR